MLLEGTDGEGEVCVGTYNVNVFVMHGSIEALCVSFLGIFAIFEVEVFCTSPDAKCIRMGGAF